MKNFLILAALLPLAACTAPDRTTDILTAQGYTDIELTGYGVFDCSEDDTFATGFKATAPNGAKVSGTVCSGLLKGSTIRFD